MNWIIDNWYILLGLLVVLIGAALAVLKFYHLPTKKQIENIKEWLLWAVTEAEKELGAGTGKLKLRQVYDWAVSKFPWLQFLPFATFSGWVDVALEQMREILKVNQSVVQYVEGIKND